MRTVTEPARELEVAAEVDVAVVGGGPSGFIAAMAAARTGARTLLLEHHSFLGGMATAALVGPISKFNSAGRRVVLGIPNEFIERLHARGGAIIDLPSGNVPFDAELYQQTAFEMTREAEAEVWLRATYANVLTAKEGRCITHVVLETKSGRMAVAARQVVDCSGSAEVVADTQLPWCYRGGPAGELQPLSLMFRLGGVDTDALQEPLMAHDATRYFNRCAREILQRAVDAGSLGGFGGPWLIYGSTFRPGEVTVNATRHAANAVAPGEFSRAEADLRRDMHAIVDLLRAEMPELRDAYLLQSATQAGIRETRSIVGLTTVTVDDLLRPGDCPDTVAFGAHPVDLHRARGPGQDVQFVDRAYSIPFRALVPQGSENVLVAGGSISATREAFASIRVQAQCMALGEAAGTAAALCAQRDIPVTQLDGTELRELLAKNGACVRLD